MIPLMIPLGTAKYLMSKPIFSIDRANVALDKKLHDLFVQDFLLFWPGPGKAVCCLIEVGGPGLGYFGMPIEPAVDIAWGS